MSSSPAEQKTPASSAPFIPINSLIFTVCTNMSASVRSQSANSEYDDVMDDAGGNEWSDEDEDQASPEDSSSSTTRQTPADTAQDYPTVGILRFFVQRTNLGSRNFQRLFGESDRIEHGYGGLRSSQRRTRGGENCSYPPVPSEAGRTLLYSGLFGNNENRVERRCNKSLSRKLLGRELGTNPSRANRLMSQGLIPSSKADLIIHYNSRCYSGQFSDDGNFFFSCTQDYMVRLYDTSNPYKWKYYKSLRHPASSWTITDASLSPDNRRLAYSSIASTVCLASTDPSNEEDPSQLDFAYMGRSGTRRRGSFGIWSIRFSGDGREIVAGTNDHSVYVYDIESQQSILRLPGHSNDVNAVCFAEGSSPHILYSGSDDTLIKVWDRRSMRHNREVGVFAGHTEGLTYVDSKGDGRYLLSNGKDQTMKLWDTRKMSSPEEAAGWESSFEGRSGFDYRLKRYPEEYYHPHPHDCSVVTFRGHSVLKTLIRCHFSPSTSSDRRYVYSGSEDGSVYIYNMDATLAKKINVEEATYKSRPRDEQYKYMSYYSNEDPGKWKACVRDASWQPNAPVIVASAWNGWGMLTGTCTIHSWHGGISEGDAEPVRVDKELKHDDELYENTTRPRRSGRLRTR